MGPPRTFEGSSGAGAWARAGAPAASVVPRTIPRLRNRRRFIATSSSGLLLERFQHPLGKKGQATYARAGGGEDGVGQRRGDHRRRGLAGAGRRLGALHHVHLDVRHLVHPENLVVLEVLLVEGAVTDRPALLERGAEAEEQPALELGAHAVGIDHEAAVHRAGDLLDPYLAGRAIDAGPDDRRRPRRLLR